MRDQCEQLYIVCLNTPPSIPAAVQVLTASYKQVHVYRSLAARSQLMPM